MRTVVFRTLLVLALLGQFSLGATAKEETRFWVAITAPDREARTAISNLGVAIINVIDDTSYAIVSQSTIDALNASPYRITKKLPLNAFRAFDFPEQDGAYHNYAELRAELEGLAAQYSNLIKLEPIGMSVNGRDILAVRINPEAGSLSDQSGKPGIIYMGGHHAREHLSMEIPLLLVRYLVENYGTDAEVTRLVDTRDIFIIPMVNPDGAEYDIESGSYRSWRKNRARENSSCAGTDLNRNYAFMWGTGGSSRNECSDVFMGAQPFSEPETMAIKNFVEYHSNLSILLSFHTYSELILYPWGHKYDSIENPRDLQTHEVLANTMAEWNGYTPQQASDLYIASGDTTDWSYGSLGIISFTFELSPSRFGRGGFYPGAGAIPTTFRANLRPILYLMDLADDPYRGVERPETTMFYGQGI